MTTLSTYVSGAMEMLRKNPEFVLGSIVYYSICESKAINGKTIPVRVTHDQLAEWFDDLNLSSNLLPARTRKIHAFRRASGTLKRTYFLDTPGMIATLRVVEMESNSDFCLRHVLRDVNDTRTSTTTTAHVATLKFFRGGKRPDGTRNSSSDHYRTAILKSITELGLDQQPTGRKFNLEPNDLDEVEKYVAEFEERYDALATYLHADAIRGVVRNYLWELNAIAVKPGGGVYFVHTTRQKTVDALQELVKRVGQGCSFNQIPLLDSRDQREMLAEAFQQDVMDEVAGLLKDIAETNEKAAGNRNIGKIPVSTYALFHTQYQNILSRAEEYTNMLGLAQGRAGAALELAFDAITEMGGRLKA